MKKLTLLALFALGAFTFQSCGGSANKDSTEVAEDANERKEDNNTMAVDDDNAEFAVAAANGGMFEVEASKLAQEKAQNARVKEFADMMVKDHTPVNEELMTLATTKNITLPSMVGEDHQKHLDELRNLSGREFDKKYVELMVDDHEKDVKLFTEMAEENDADADLKAFAAKVLPTIKSHETMVKGIHDSMK